MAEKQKWEITKARMQSSRWGRERERDLAVFRMFLDMKAVVRRGKKT